MSRFLTLPLLAAALVGTGCSRETAAAEPPSLNVAYLYGYGLDLTLPHGSEITSNSGPQVLVSVREDLGELLVFVREDLEALRVWVTPTNPGTVSRYVATEIAPAGLSFELHPSEPSPVPSGAFLRLLVEDLKFDEEAVFRMEVECASGAETRHTFFREDFEESVGRVLLLPFEYEEKRGELLTFVDRRERVRTVLLLQVGEEEVSGFVTLSESRASGGREFESADFALTAETRFEAFDVERTFGGLPGKATDRRFRVMLDLGEDEFPVKNPSKVPELQVFR